MKISPHPTDSLPGADSPDSCAAMPAAPAEGPWPASGGVPTPGAGRAFGGPEARGAGHEERRRAAGPSLSVPHEQPLRPTSHVDELLRELRGADTFGDESAGLPAGDASEDGFDLAPGDVEALEREAGGSRRGRRRAHPLSAAGAGGAIALALFLHSLGAGPIGQTPSPAIRSHTGGEPRAASPGLGEETRERRLARRPSAGSEAPAVRRSRAARAAIRATPRSTVRDAPRVTRAGNELTPAPASQEFGFER